MVTSISLLKTEQEFVDHARENAKLAHKVLQIAHHAIKKSTEFKVTTH